MEGLALMSFNQYLDTLGEADPRNWRMLREFLEASFGNPVSNVELLMRLLSTYERNPRARYQAFMRQVAEINNGTYDQLIVAAFLQGLPKEISNVVLQHPPANLQEAVVAAERLFRVQRPRDRAPAANGNNGGNNNGNPRANAEPRPEVRCTYCNYRNHTEAECRRKQREQQQPQPLPKN
jgi:hypothetical protein